MHPDDRDDDDLRTLLASLDHVLPEISAASIAATARARRPRPWHRWAAALLLTLGAAGVALAAPGSPVPRWVAALVAELRKGFGPPGAGPSQAQREDRSSAGISVAPGRALAIVFASPEAGGLARVSLGDRREVVVRAPSGAADFTSEPDHLLIEDLGPADTFAIEIPRAAPKVEVIAGGARILLAEHGRVTASTAPDSLGSYHLPLPIGRSR